jgi:hypothetical protein
MHLKVLKMRFILNINKIRTYVESEKYISIKVTFRLLSFFGLEFSTVVWLWWAAAGADLYN